MIQPVTTMGQVVTETVSVTTTGAENNATGSASSGTLNGLLLDIYLDYHASCPAGADVTVSYATRGGTIAVNGNSATDVLITPRVKPVDNANSAITGAHDKFPLDQAITVSVAQANALTACVVAYIRYLRG